MFAEHPEDNSLQDTFNLILNNLDRLEIRGRDSAGLSLLVVLQESHYTSFMKTLAVETRLRSLHPVGMHVRGGLDSSSLAVLAAYQF